MFSRLGFGVRIINIEFELCQVVQGVLVGFKTTDGFSPEIGQKVLQTADTEIIIVPVNGYSVTCTPHTLAIEQGNSTAVVLDGKRNQIIQLATKRDTMLALGILRHVPSSNTNHAVLVDSLIEIVNSYTF